MVIFSSIYIYLNLIFVAGTTGEDTFIGIFKRNSEFPNENFHLFKITPETLSCFWFLVNKYHTNITEYIDDDGIFLLNFLNSVTSAYIPNIDFSLFAPPYL